MKTMAKDHIDSKCGLCVHSQACMAWIQHGSTLYSDFSYSVEDCPDYASSADVVEVKHGRWISDDRDVLFSCSECGVQISTSWDYESLAWDFCPNCGAKMDGDSND